MQRRTWIKEYVLIFLGSILYAISTDLFIFPNGLLLGGTSGIAVILASFIPLSPGTFSVILNLTLILVAFIVLGKDMAVKTLVGSLLTTIFIGAFERLFAFDAPLISNFYLSAVIGGTIIAMASGLMFYVDSSSGGTDIIALIVKKFFPIKIGTALLITDILIVLIGGLLSGVTLLLSSFVGFLVKTLGINLVIFLIQKATKCKKQAGSCDTHTG